MYNCGKLENLTYPQLKFNFNTALMALIKEIAESRRQIIKNIFEATTISTSRKPLVNNHFTPFNRIMMDQDHLTDHMIEL